MTPMRNISPAERKYAPRRSRPRGGHALRRRVRLGLARHRRGAGGFSRARRAMHRAVRLQPRSGRGARLIRARRERAPMAGVRLPGHRAVSRLELLDAGDLSQGDRRGRALTDGVAAGRTTRAQRAERIRQLLANIDRTEETNRAKIEQMEAVNRVVQEETARQLDPMRRSLMVPLAR